MRVILIIGLQIGLLGSVGCQESMYGSGTVYLWNGSIEQVAIKIDGRTPIETTMRAEIGMLYEDVIAGEYLIKVGDEDPYKHTLEKGHMLIVNNQGLGCFTRCNVVGMYKQGRDPVEVLEIYEKRELVDIADSIAVLPGKRLPVARPKSSFGMQRVAVIPCDIATDRNEVKAFVRRLR